MELWTVLGVGAEMGRRRVVCVTFDDDGGKKMTCHGSPCDGR